MNALIEIPYGVKLFIDRADAGNVVQMLQKATFVKEEGYGKGRKLIEVNEEVEIKLLPFGTKIYDENSDQVKDARIKKAEDEKDQWLKHYQEATKELNELKRKLGAQAVGEQP